MLISIPAGLPITVPSGSVLVCQAGTNLIQPQSKLTVPPKFGSLTFSTPCSPSQPASSTRLTQWAPVRVATATASAMWSAWPWLIAITLGSTSSAVATAIGLFGFRNGSVRTVVSASLNSKQDWPWNLISISGVSLLVLAARVIALNGRAQLLVQCPADGDPNHHPHPRLLGE